jgi:hypothetical protein
LKIELTQEQINLLTKEAEKKLIDEFNAAKAKLEKKLEEDIAALKGKFRYVEIPVAEKEDKPAQKKSSTRSKIDADKLTEMLTDGKSFREIADFFGTTANSIRSKVYLLKRKIR